MRPRRLPRALAGVLAVLLLAPPSPAQAWPTPLVESLTRDAQRLLPASLARLISERERAIVEESRRLPPELTSLLARDLVQGQLARDTINAFDAEVAGVVALFKAGRVSDGVVRLGALLRVPADVSDPVLAAGSAGYPAGVTSEYYTFIQTNLDKIPVVLSDPPALKLERRALGVYWQALLGRSREQAPVIRTEMVQGGRVVSHRQIDFRSPVFGVASLSYSRAVTGIAATWLAVWREARGDLTRIKPPRERKPRDGGPAAPSPY